MKCLTVRRYSISFKRQVVSDLESGRFESIESARRHYGIGGRMTVQNWVRKYGKNHLLPKVVLVQKPDERDQIRTLKQQLAELQRALGQTQVENVLNAEFLKIACEELDCDVDAFKKKVLGPIPGTDLTTTTALRILRFIKNIEICKETVVVERRTYRLAGRMGRLSDRNRRTL